MIAIFIIICTCSIFFIKLSLENKISILSLRSTPINIYSQPQATSIFNLNDNYRPMNYIKQKKYIDHNNDTISELTTALMWQKDGSSIPLNYQSGTNYIKRLNENQYKGFNDWRLPTVEELMSLLEPKKNPLFINNLFNNKGMHYWSADKLAAKTPFGERVNSAWGVDFSFGYVFWAYLKTENYVKAVRSIGRIQRMGDASLFSLSEPGLR